MRRAATHKGCAVHAHQRSKALARDDQHAGGARDSNEQTFSTAAAVEVGGVSIYKWASHVEAVRLIGRN